MTIMTTLTTVLGLSIASASLAQTGGQSAGNGQGSHKVAASHPNKGGTVRHRRSAGSGARDAKAHTTPSTGMGEGTTNSGMTEATTPH